MSQDLAASALAATARVGPTAVDPWMWQENSWAVLAIMLAIGITLSVRAGRLHTMLLLSLAGASMWWQETYGDWACYLLYSPDFAQIGWWGNTPYTSPNKPWGLIPAYAWFYAGYFLLVVAAAQWIHRKWFAQRSLMWVTAIVGSLIWYAFDLGVEGFSTYKGWWDYTATIGPVLATQHGTFPLVYPILEQTPFMAAVPCLLLARDKLGRPLLDIPFVGIAAGWKRESARLAVWVVGFNVSFGLFLILPLMLLRTVFGPASSLVP